MSKINNILKLEDEVAIIEAIGEIIWQKKEETGEFSDLTDAEKVFVFIDILVEDICISSRIIHMMEGVTGD